MKDTDGTYLEKPDDKWEFNSGVANCFEDMLQRSIPQYDIMRNSVIYLSAHFLDKTNFCLLDLGCSDGLGTQDFITKYGAHGKYTLVDCSEPMLDKARERYSGWVQTRVVDIMNMDLRKEFPKGVYDIILVELTLMFTPINYRQRIIQNIYDHLKSGGVVFIVEKVLGESALINDLLVEEYHDLKRNNGYSDEQIERKTLALEGVQVPVTNSWNMEMLKQAGFRQIDVFWRWANFVGYIAIK